MCVCVCVCVCMCMYICIYVCYDLNLLPVTSFTTGQPVLKLVDRL